MYFTDFPGTNHAFGKPSNVREDQCGTLRVKHALTDVNGTAFPVSISGWKPSAEDLERLNAGGLIYLNVFGNGHPMVSVSTEMLETKPIPSSQPIDN